MSNNTGTPYEDLLQLKKITELIYKESQAREDNRTYDGEKPLPLLQQLATKVGACPLPDAFANRGNYRVFCKNINDAIQTNIILNQFVESSKSARRSFWLTFFTCLASWVAVSVSIWIAYKK